MHTQTIESLLPKKERKPTFYYKCLKKKCFSQCGNLIPTECCICGIFFMLVPYCPNGNLPMGNMVRFLHGKALLEFLYKCCKDKGFALPWVH